MESKIRTLVGFDGDIQKRRQILIQGDVLKEKTSPYQTPKFGSYGPVVRKETDLDDGDHPSPSVMEDVFVAPVRMLRLHLFGHHIVEAVKEDADGQDRRMLIGTRIAQDCDGKESKPKDLAQQLLKPPANSDVKRKSSHEIVARDRGIY